tara:strand:+ start:1506 stop:3554 length:2049 start_codon:yes stop_codon:yes gene_type:complete
MQKLQLYISGERIDLFRDESVSMTQTIQNVKDISKIFTEFTQTFTLPASSTNNKIFKHYYNFDISGGFDARNKVNASIELNYIPFKTGFIKLEGVEMKKNKAYNYRITFFGNTINLKDLLGEDLLSSLSTLNSYNLIYNSTNIKNNLEGSLGTIITPLITHTDQLYYNSSETNTSGNLYPSGTNGVLWSQLKFAIRLNPIIDAIESRYAVANGFSSNIVFSNDFLNNSAPFGSLYMWLHRKTGDVEPAQQVSISYNQVPEFTNTVGTPDTGMVNGALRIFTQNIQYGALLQNDLVLTPTSGTNTIPYNVQIFKNGSLFYQITDLIGTQTIGKTEMGSLTPADYTVSIGSTGSVIFSAGDIEWIIAGTGASTGWSDQWDSTLQFEAVTTFDFIITQQIPEIKVIDFLTGIFKMFNLTAYVDETNTIVVKTLDSYYSASSVVWDIDKYLDVKTSQVNVALPFKEIEFSYSGRGTLLAKQYEQLENIGWGTLRYTLNNETFDAPNNTYKVSVPFEHMQFERLADAGTTAYKTIQYGRFVNDNQQSYFGKPLIFYGYKIENGTDIAILTSPSVAATINDYIIPSNSLDIDSSVSTTNINFSLEVNEYTLDSSFTGTLFQNNYLTYISDVFNSSRRLTKIKAFLPLQIIYNLQLNDKLKVRQQNYKINSLTTNLISGESSIEILNVV